jgi:hypothetical protein
MTEIEVHIFFKTCPCLHLLEFVSGSKSKNMYVKNAVFLVLFET